MEKKGEGLETASNIYSGLTLVGLAHVVSSVSQREDYDHV